MLSFVQLLFVLTPFHTTFFPCEHQTTEHTKQLLTCNTKTLPNKPHNLTTTHRSYYHHSVTESLSH
nr:MAG TPA: hypothetical protein [Caudoviricetes sp.]